MENQTLHHDPCSICKETYCVSKISLFSHLDREDMTKVLKKIDRRKYKKGEFLFRPGETAERLWIVNEGSVKVFRYTIDGKEQILYLLTEGNFLGDLNLFKENRYEYYSSALENTRLCTLTRKNFQQLLLEVPTINEKILAYAYDRISSLEKQIQTVTSKDVSFRLANFLLHFSRHFGIKKGEEIEITFPISREDIANYLGLTRETVSRQLSQFQGMNLIIMEGNKKVRILDIEELRHLAADA